MLVCPNPTDLIKFLPIQILNNSLPFFILFYHGRTSTINAVALELLLVLKKLFRVRAVFDFHCSSTLTFSVLVNVMAFKILDR